MGYLLATVVSIFVISAVLQRASTYFAYLKAKKNGCRRAARYPNWEPFLGLDLFWSVRKANRMGKESIFKRNLHKTYGRTYEAKLCSNTAVFTAHPENIQSVTSTNFTSWGVGPTRGRTAPLMGPGIFSGDGDFWKHSKLLLQPLFNHAEVSDFESFEHMVEEFMGLLPSDGRSFDIQPLAKRLFLDSMSEFIFGLSFDALKPERQKDAAEFMKAFDRGMLHIGLRNSMGSLHQLVKLDPGYKPAYTIVHRFTDKLIHKALEEQKESERTRRYDLLKEMTPRFENRALLRNNILSVFFAARDTTAVLFSNALWELARSPHEWKAIRDEALSLLEPFTFEKLGRLKTVQAVMKETLRLHPNANLARRAALCDTILPRGGGPDGESSLFVPKGRTVTISIFSVQRDPTYWGPDVEEFKPQRWMGENPPHEPWAYVPFLAGQRQCLGQRQVEAQFSYLLVRVARDFSAIECRDKRLDYVEHNIGLSSNRRGTLIALIP